MSMKKNTLIIFSLLELVYSLHALSGRVVPSSDLFKEIKFTQSYILVNQRGIYYPVEPDGYFDIPSDKEELLSLTTYIPGFQKITQTYQSDAKDVRLVVQIQIVSMEDTIYDAEVPKWILDQKKDFNDSTFGKKQDDIASLLPFQAKPGMQSADGTINPPEISLDVGKLINLILRIIKH